MGGRGERGLATPWRLARIGGRDRGLGRLAACAVLVGLGIG
jgi:hypothetical protein